MKFLLVFSLAIAATITVHAQNKPRLVTGLVTTEEDSRPIEGALVWVKGTKNYSGSQPDGIFYIEINRTDSVLVFSYAGYHKAEVDLTGRSEYNVQLKKDRRPVAKSQ